MTNTEKLAAYGRSLLQTRPPPPKEDINDRWEIAAAGLLQLFIAEVSPEETSSSKVDALFVKMITTAYEQGVGKGHLAFSVHLEIENPYGDPLCREAWAYGYSAGKIQAERIQRASKTILNLGS